MDRAVWCEGILLMGFASIGLFEGARLTTVSLVSPEPLGPGWYLFAVSALLFIAGAAYTAKHARRGTADGRGSLTLRFGPAAMAVLLMIVYVAAMPVAGYLISTVVFFVFALHIFGVNSWLRSAILGVVLAVIFQFGFGELAGMVLP